MTLAMNTMVDDDDEHNATNVLCERKQTWNNSILAIRAQNEISSSWCRSFPNSLGYCARYSISVSTFLSLFFRFGCSFIFFCFTRHPARRSHYALICSVVAISLSKIVCSFVGILRIETTITNSNVIIVLYAQANYYCNAKSSTTDGGAEWFELVRLHTEYWTRANRTRCMRIDVRMCVCVRAEGDESRLVNDKKRPERTYSLNKWQWKRHTIKRYI